MVAGGGVDAAPAFLGGAGDGGGLLSEYHAAVGDGIDADIEESSPGETGGVHAVPRHHLFTERGHANAKIGVELLQVADGLFG